MRVMWMKSLIYVVLEVLVVADVAFHLMVDSLSSFCNQKKVKPLELQLNEIKLN